MIPLFTHQKSDIKFELKNKVVYDSSDAGTGKTRTRLEVFSQRRAAGGKCMLVLAPRSLLEPAWKNDCKKYTPWLKIVCAYATNREEAFKQQADIYVTNHDAATWLAKQKPAFFAKFDSLVVDESGAYKHHTSKRSKAVTKIAKYFKYRVCMNGTPNPNSVTDIWHQIFILDGGSRLGPSFFAFRAATQEPERVGKSVHAIKWTDRPGAEEAVAKLIKDITIRHTLLDCHDIPENHVYTIPYTLPESAMKHYRTMEASYVAKVKDGTIKAVNAAVAVGKLLQISSGAVYEDEETYHVLDTGRYELVADLVEQRGHCVVFFLWQHQRDMLIKEFESRGITFAVMDGSVSAKKRNEIVRDYQRGLYRILLAHPKTAAHGLTLTKGTTTIWPGPTYDLEWWLQGNRRIYRAGQTQKTETICIVEPNTRDLHVYEGILMPKDSKMKSFLEILAE